MRAMREMGKFSFLQTSPAEVTETTVLDVTDVGYRSWFCIGCFFFSSLFSPPYGVFMIILIFEVYFMITQYLFFLPNLPMKVRTESIQSPF